MAYYEDIIEETCGQTKCVLCEEFIPDNVNIIEVHINGEIHRTLYTTRLMIQNNINIVKKQVYCVICDTAVLGDLKHHIRSPQHHNKMSIIYDVVEKDGAFIELPQYTSQAASTTHCSICNEYVDFTLKQIREHLCGARHRQARAMAVQPFNGIFSVEGSNTDLYCKICKMYFPNYIETIFEHVDENKYHCKELSDILKLIKGQNMTIDNFLTNATEDKAFCNKCQTHVPCNLDNLERHTNKHNK